MLKIHIDEPNEVPAIDHRREILFTETVEFVIQDLPRWKPHIHLDEHIPDDDLLT